MSRRGAGNKRGEGDGGNGEDEREAVFHRILLLEITLTLCTRAVRSPCAEREIAAKSPRRWVVDPAVRVRAVRLARPEAVGELAVRGRMRELHGGRNAELGEAGEVVGREQLCVLDPLAQAPWRPRLARRLERIERVAVCVVADRVHGDRHPDLGGAPDDLLELRVRGDLD